MMPKQTIDLESSICGIPCGIHIDTLQVVKPFRGSPHLCDSADDFYGYSEIEFTVLDRKGYPAPWLEDKLTPAITADIEIEILTHIEETYYD